MEKGYLVTKSNKLMTASYDLSLQEQKIILTLASMVQPQDTEFKEYEFKIKDFMNLLNVDTKTKYTEIPKITKELMKKVFEIREGNDIIQLAWLCSARYKTKQGTVILKFSPDLKPYMLQLKELYTSYKLENVLSLKSKYSIRLYEILKSNLYKKQVVFELEELRKMVGAKEKAYNTYANFKNKVILQAQEELKEKTDISFDFEEIKTGRKVTSIKFTIYNNKLKEVEDKAAKEILVTQEEDPEPIQQIKAIINEPITSMEAFNIFEVANGDIELIKAKYEIAQGQDIKNIVGWLIKAIENDYKEPKEKKAKNSFNSYSGQRQYNIEELEKQLLGRV